MRRRWRTRRHSAKIGRASREAHRGGDGVFGGELKGLDAAADLVGVAADGGGVVEDELELLLRVDDEDGADGEGKALVVEVGGVVHVVLDGDGAIGVANDGKVDGDLVFAVSDDVPKPGVVRIHRVHGEGRNLRKREFVYPRSEESPSMIQQGRDGTAQPGHMTYTRLALTLRSANHLDLSASRPISVVHTATTKQSENKRANSTYLG